MKCLPLQFFLSLLQIFFSCFFSSQHFYPYILNLQYVILTINTNAHLTTQFPPPLFSLNYYFPIIYHSGKMAVHTTKLAKRMKTIMKPYQLDGSDRETVKPFLGQFMRACDSNEVFEGVFK